jgi:hypothetical protein
MADIVPVGAFAQPVIGGEYSNQTASALIKTGDGHLLGIFVNSGTPTIKVWDNTSAATTVMFNTFQTVAATWYPLPAHFKTGCYVTITGTADITVVYK